MKKLGILIGVGIIASLGILTAPTWAQETAHASSWSLWVGSHYTGLENFYKKVGEFDRGEEGAMPEVSFTYRAYDGPRSLDLFGQFYDPKRLSLNVSGRASDVLSGKVSYQSFFRQQSADLMDNLSVREAKTRDDLGPDNGGGKMVTHDPVSGNDFGYTRHRVDSKVEVKVPGTAGVRFHASYRGIIDNGEEQKIVSMHCSSCHQVSMSIPVDRQTHNIRGGVEGDLGPVSVSYNLGYRSFVSNAATATAFYDTAQHPVSGGAQADFDKRVIFNAEVVPFGQYAQIEALTHTLKANTALGKTKIFGSFTSSAADNTTSDIGFQSNVGSLKLVHPTSRKTKLVVQGTFQRNENDSYFVDLAPWRDGLPGGGQNFDYTRYSNLSRTKLKGSGKFIYQPRRQYRFTALAGYETIARDDYPYYGADEKETIARGELGFRYRPSLKFTGQAKLRLESIDNPFAPYGQLYESYGKTSLNTIPGNSNYYYFQRDSLRYGEFTNQPTSRIGGDLKLSLRPTGKVTLRASLRATLEKNSDLQNLQYERTIIQPMLSASLAPSSDWTFHADYSYLMDESNGLAVVAMMDG